MMDAEERERRVQGLIDELRMSRGHAEFMVSLDRTAPNTDAIAREWRAAERRVGNDRRDPRRATKGPHMPRR